VRTLAALRDAKQAADNATSSDATLAATTEN